MVVEDIRIPVSGSPAEVPKGRLQFRLAILADGHFTIITNQGCFVNSLPVADVAEEAARDVRGSVVSASGILSLQWFLAFRDDLGALKWVEVEQQAT